MATNKPNKQKCRQKFLSLLATAGIILNLLPLSVIPQVQAGGPHLQVAFDKSSAVLVGIPQGTQSFEFARFVFTAQAEEDLLIERIRFHQYGSLDLFRELRSYRLIDSKTGEVFNYNVAGDVQNNQDYVEFQKNIRIPAGEARTLAFVANVEPDANAGDTIGIEIRQDQIKAIGADTSNEYIISGEFPVMGNWLWIVDKNYYGNLEVKVSADNPQAAQVNRNEKFPIIKLDFTTKCDAPDVVLNKIDFFQTGTLPYTKLANITLTPANSDSPLASGTTSSGHVIFSSPVTLKSCQITSLIVNGVISADASDGQTLGLKLQAASSIEAATANYGFVVPATGPFPLYGNEFTVKKAALPDLVVEDIQFRKTYGNETNVITAKICNRGQADTPKADIYSVFDSGSKQPWYAMHATTIWVGLCSEISMPVKEMGYTSSGNYTPEIRTDTNHNVTESNEGNNYAFKTVYVDLGETTPLPPITDLRIEGDKLIWTAPSSQIKYYYVQFYTGETTDPNATFGGCSSAEPPSNSTWCAGQPVDITAQPGHKEILKLTKSPVKTFIVRYQDFNGRTSSKSNLVVYQKSYPDLRTEEINFYKEWKGMSNVFVALVCNRGTAPTPSNQSFFTAFFANGLTSTNESPNFEPYGLWNDGCYFPFATAESLKITTSQNYTVTVSADSTNRIVELDEVTPMAVNNSKTATIYVDLGNSQTTFNGPKDLHVIKICEVPGCNTAEDIYHTALEWTNPANAVSFGAIVYTGEVSSNWPGAGAYPGTWYTINESNKRNAFNFTIDPDNANNKPINVAIRLKDAQGNISTLSNTYTLLPEYSPPTPTPTPTPSPTPSPSTQIPPAGYEDKVITNYELYESPFADTENSSRVGIAAAELYRRAVIGGYQNPKGGKPLFKEKKLVNRAEAAKFLLLARYGKVPYAENNGKFIDIPDAHQWYTDFVMRASALGIISGYPDRTFRPARTVNTVEFLKMLTLTFGLEENLPYNYTDCAATDWYSRYCGIAQRYNLFPDRGTLILPASELTRGEIAIALYNLLLNR